MTASNANGAYRAGQAIHVQVAFSEPVTVTGTPRLDLASTPARVATYASGSGTRTLSFDYTVQTGDAAVDLDYAASSALALDGGSIRNAAGSNATLTLPAPGAPGSLGANRDITIDTAAPTVTGVTASDPNGSYGSGQVIHVQVTFSEPVTVSGTPQLSVAVGTPVAVNYRSGSGTTTLQFDYTVQPGHASPRLDYSSTSALATNGGTIVDRAGNDAVRTLPTPGAPGSLGVNRSIAIDGIAPTVAGVSASDPNGAYRAGQVIHLQVDFSEPVTVTGTPQLTLAIGTPAAVNYSSGSGTVTLRFDYTVRAGDSAADLDYAGTSALVLNGATIRDAAANDANRLLAAPGANGSLSAAKNIVLDTSVPSTIVGFPAGGGLYNPSRWSSGSTACTGTTVAGICGTAGDTGSAGVQRVEISLRDGTGNYFGGTSFDRTDETYLAAAGAANWHFDLLASKLMHAHGYTLHVRATDGAGNVETAQTRSFGYDSVAPTVSDVTASTGNGSYNAGTVIHLQVVLSEPVTVSGAAQLTLETGAIDQSAAYASGSGTAVLGFDYTVQPGDTSPDLNQRDTAALSLAGGTIADAAGNDLIRTLPAAGSGHSLAENKALVIDTTPPTVSHQVFTAMTTTHAFNSAGWSGGTSGCPAAICGTSADIGSGLQSVLVSVLDSRTKRFYGGTSSATPPRRSWRLSAPATGRSPCRRRSSPQATRTPCTFVRSTGPATRRHKASTSSTTRRPRLRRSSFPQQPPTTQRHGTTASRVAAPRLHHRSVAPAPMSIGPASPRSRSHSST